VSKDLRLHRPPQGPPRRPLVGVTPDLAEPGPQAPSARYELKVSYADAVLRAGGLPVLLPYAEEAGVVEQYLDRVSGLVITGGAFDVPPSLYGEQAREGLGPLKPGRTAFEAALLRGALARNLPVLGVCGGMQLLNVLLGGTLIQDLRRELPDANDHQQQHDRAQPHHPVEVKEGTILAELLGKGNVMVNSTHHQAARTLGEGVRASAVAPDGVVEAVESERHAFAIGVQWHPEALIHTVPSHLAIYKGLVARAKELRR
jgi:putative glutamine amidotransferase